MRPARTRLLIASSLVTVALLGGAIALATGRPRLIARALALGGEAEEVKDLETAESWYGRALWLEAPNVEARFGRARVRLARGDRHGAKLDIEEAIALDPSAEDHWVLRANLNDEVGALHDLDAAIALAPLRHDILARRALQHLWLGRLDDALADLDRALAIAPRDVETLLLRVRVRRLRGDARGASADLELARQLDPAAVAAFEREARQP